MVPLVAWLWLGCAHHVEPVAAPPLQAPPRATARASVCWLEFAQAGAFTASGLLVRGPAGTVLVDAGQSRSFGSEVREVSRGKLYLRLVPGQLKPKRPASEILAEAGVDPSSLAAFVPTHAHSDHLGGLMDLPELPVRMHEEEQALLERVEAGQQAFNVLPAQARRVLGQITPLSWTDAPYSAFPRHADLLGDGTVVIVPLEGHTPGSVGVVVDAGNVRLLHAGDALNRRAQLERLLGKSALLRRTDADRDRADGRVSLLAALHEADPELLVLPAHERRAWKATFGKPGSCIGP